MAEPIPEKLRLPDITRLLKRGNQLRTVKPAMAYWCDYSAVLRIMKAQLHNADADCMQFTTNLMDRLEQVKQDHPTDDALMDDTAAQLYVAQFAQDTFERAERVLYANKVTRQTADTFDAAATFLLVGSVWADLDKDTLDKIKFAKWNAARILKALREGLDPNDSNPAQPEPQPQPADDNDPEVQLITGTSSAAAPSRAARVEDAVSDDDDNDSGTGNVPTNASFATPTAPAVVSPPDLTPNIPSVPSQLPGAGYFDSSAPARNTPSPPPAQNTFKAPDPWVLPQTPGTPQPRSDSRNSDPPIEDLGFSPPPSRPVVTQPPPPPPPAPTQPSIKPVVAAPSPAAPPLPPPSGKYSLDEGDIAKAQKHAKWAISALNFDDVPTAVKELRNALATLER